MIVTRDLLRHATKIARGERGDSRANKLLVNYDASRKTYSVGIPDPEDEAEDYPSVKAMWEDRNRLWPNDWMLPTGWSMIKSPASRLDPGDFVAFFEQDSGRWRIGYISSMPENDKLYRVSDGGTVKVSFLKDGSIFTTMIDIGELNLIFPPMLLLFGVPPSALITEARKSFAEAMGLFPY